MWRQNVKVNNRRQWVSAERRKVNVNLSAFLTLKMDRGKWTTEKTADRKPRFEVRSDKDVSAFVWNRKMVIQPAANDCTDWATNELSTLITVPNIPSSNDCNWDETE